MSFFYNNFNLLIKFDMIATLAIGLISLYIGMYIKNNFVFLRNLVFQLLLLEVLFLQ